MAARADRGDDRRPAVLIAGFPDEGDEGVPAAMLLEIEEALLSFARAALARQRRIVLPADRIVAPLVAQVAAEYLSPLRTEARERERPLVEVMLTEGRDPDLELELARLGGVEARVFAPSGEELHPGEAEEIEWTEHSGRHRLTPQALAGAEPWIAVVVGGAPEMLEDVGLLAERRVPLGVIGPTLTGPALDAPWAGEDVTAELLAEIEWPRWSDEHEGERGDRGARARVPYPYLMQQLMARGDEDGVPVEAGGRRLGHR